MTKKQQENEVKYRLSIMMLLELKYKGQITNESFNYYHIIKRSL